MLVNFQPGRGWGLNPRFKHNQNTATFLFICLLCANTIVSHKKKAQLVRKC